MALALLKPESGRLDTPQQHYDLLHTPSHGTAILWERATSADKSGAWLKLGQGDAHIPALLAAQAGQPDRYITVNEFHAWRIVRNLRSLRACYVDIDGSEDLHGALECLRDAQLPAPSCVIFSGRGMHLYWLHEPVPQAALPVWQRCQDALVSALKPLGADPAAKDCARVLRLAGTINSKNSSAVRGVVFDAEHYGFRHLCDEILGYRKPRTGEVRDLATARARRGLPVPKGSIYARWHLVYRDLVTISEYHTLGGIPEGHRNNWLFLSAVALSWFANPHTLRDELERLAQAWTPGLTHAEVRSAIQSPLERATLASEGHMFEWEGVACDPRYKFRRETLYRWMEPLIPEDLAPQLRAIVSDQVKAEHKRETDRKHEEARPSRDRVAEGRRKSHKVGRSLGSTKANSVAQLKPWETMGISRRTYYNRKKAGML